MITAISENKEPKKLKNLANCTPVEFLRQTNKIRHQVAGWLKETGVLEIRKHTCDLVAVTENMNAEERALVEAENKKRIDAQTKKNISDMLDAALDANAEKTYELLALLCFIDPENAGDVKPFVLMQNFTEMLADEDVMGFFSSLMRSGLMTISQE